MQVFTFAILFLVIVCQQSALAERRCRCLPNDSTCWPKASVWESFNASIHGRLISARPSAAVCNLLPLNVDGCATARRQWTNATWRAAQVGAMQSPNWESSSCSVTMNSTTCNQGSVPILAVDATLPEHVQATVRFARTHRLRLVIKTTGHDFLGRSTAAGALLLWLHHMKNRTLIPSWRSCTGQNIDNVIRIAAGVQWGEVYHWLGPYNLTAIGGASPTVGAAGGFLQGGGHGPLTRWKGLAVDQVLEFDVVMADGRRETANACQNTDLFWALRGGGAGTFAVVLSVLLRTHPMPSVVGTFQHVTAPNESRYAKLMHHFVELLPSLADAGWAGYFYITGRTLTLALLAPNGDLTTAYTSVSQLFDNHTDLNFTQPYVFPVPTFLDYFAAVMEQSSPTGSNYLLGSRLIPESLVRAQSHQVADAFLQAKGADRSLVIGHMIAGGQVSDRSHNNSVNPVWRSTLLHMIYAESWSDGLSTSEQEELARRISKKVEILQTVAGGAQSGSYMNEADPQEVDWRQKFFGTRELYDRLKVIKDRVDPDGLFVCARCVGSDDWSADLNCPRVSNANTPKAIIVFIALYVFVIKI